MQNQQHQTGQHGSQIPYQPYPNEPPPSYDMAMGQDSPATAPPAGHYEKNLAPTAPPAGQPYAVSSGQVYSFPDSNIVSAPYPTQPQAPPHLTAVNYPRQPPGTQISMVGNPPLLPGPMVQNQHMSNTTRTLTGVSAGLIVLFILILIIFKFFIQVF